MRSESATSKLLVEIVLWRSCRGDRVVEIVSWRSCRKNHAEPGGNVE